VNHASTIPRPLLATARPRRGAWRAPLAPADQADGQLELSVWLRLLKARSLLLRELRPRLPDGLTVPQFDTLAQLQRRPAGMTPGELTRELLVTAGNVTGIVARLARRGLLERRPVPEDGRRLVLRLTPRGRALMDRAIPRHRRDVRSLLGTVPRADLERLRDLLGALTQGPRPAQRRLASGGRGRSQPRRTRRTRR
jgi:DNA-binding MarR family transcriptional regulator